MNDVYKSIDGGINWTIATTTALWSKRWGHSAVAVGNIIVLAGGYDGTYYYNDVYMSSDGGIWILMTDAADWAPRRGHGMVALETDIYLIGGGNLVGNIFLIKIKIIIGTDICFNEKDMRMYGKVQIMDHPLR